MNFKSDVTIVRIFNLFNWPIAWLLKLIISIWKHLEWFYKDFIIITKPLKVLSNRLYKNYLIDIDNGKHSL
jgi:hypothetical protein